MGRAVGAARRPGAGETVPGHAFTMLGVGKGANVAYAARLVGRGGDDRLADMALAPAGPRRVGLAAVFPHAGRPRPRPRPASLTSRFCPPPPRSAESRPPRLLPPPRAPIVAGMTRAFLAGAGVGAGLMYALDPEQGRRRRALARDQAVHLLRKSRDAVDATVRDATNRARGMLAEARARLAPPEAVPDDVLVGRVREKLGHYCAHPGSIEVTATNGRVTLTGVILASEVHRLVRTVRRVRGVRAVESRLEVHERPDDVPGLQGGIARTGERPELLQSSWSPTARVLAGAAGAAFLASTSARRSLLARLVGVAAMGLLARAVTNVDPRALLGTPGHARRGGSHTRAASAPEAAPGTRPDVAAAEPGKTRGQVEGEPRTAEDERRRRNA